MGRIINNQITIEPFCIVNCNDSDCVHKKVDNIFMKRNNIREDFLNDRPIKCSTVHICIPMNLYVKFST